MRRVVVTADSTSDLSKELIEKFGIVVVPLYVQLGTSCCKDGEMNPDKIYEYYEKTKELAKTSAVSIDDYKRLFEKYRAQGLEVVHVNISGALSASNQNALVAAKELEGVYVVDSLSLSTGTGLLAIAACELADQGKGGEEIARILDEKKRKLDVSFVISTLEYLKKGGRCSALAAFGANVLGLKPCIKMKDGALAVGTKYKGAYKKCMAKYVADLFEDAARVDTGRVFITHSGIGDDVIQTVREELLKYVKFEEVLVTRAGSTVSVHCGPGTLGVLFFRK